MRLTVADARTLAEAVMRSLAYAPADAALIADHLIDCELRGVHYGGLPRALSIADRLKQRDHRRPIRIERETAVSARIDGGDQIGYLVAHFAMRTAIAKATTSGLAVVGACDTWYTGMLSYYAEMATSEGLVTLIASNASPWVAPHGASEGLIGTNPICVGFPSTGDPVIWDVGTSSIMHAEVVLARRLGQPLPDGVAFGPDGDATRDAEIALKGAFATWGGHKGSGLALVVQMLGALAGSPFIPPDLAEFGIFILAMRPDLLTSANEFRAGVSEFADTVRQARPIAGGPPVRMPFDRSRAERARRIADDAIEVEDAVYAALLSIARSDG
jgi:delta1-piperideine-2-carboxylate reductase